MINEVILIGRLGLDPELRYTQTNQPVCNLNIATTEQYKKKGSEEIVKNTQWHRVTVWGKQAETCNRYLKKGSLIRVRGKLIYNKTSKNEGSIVHHYNTGEIVAEPFGIKFLSSNQQDNQQGNQQQNNYNNNQQPYGQNRQPYGNSQPQQPNQSSYNQPPPFDDNYIPTDPGDDDIPF